jgi:hypothetical protein
MVNEVINSKSICDWRGGKERPYVKFESLEGSFIEITIAGQTVRVDAGYLKTVISDL